MIIEYSKIHDSAHDPDRANPSDAGLDVFFSPSDNIRDYVEIAPGENAMLGTGLKFGIPHGYMLQVMNRSSMAAKKGLVVGARCVDSGYNGEVFIDLHNISNIPQTVEAGDKIAQVVMVPVVHFRAFEADEDELYEDAICISARDDGALGSTGSSAGLYPSPQQSLDMFQNKQSEKDESEPLEHPLNGMPSGF